MTVVDFGLPNATRLVLKQDGDKLTGTVGNQALEGTLAGVEISFKVGNREARGKLTGGVSRNCRSLPPLKAMKTT
jgi:hypothetical protein